MFTGKGKEIAEKKALEEQKRLEEEKRKQEQNELKKLRKNFKIGDKVKVALPNSETYVEFWSHQSYVLSQQYQIYPSICTRHIEPDAYDKAVSYLRKNMKNLKGKELEHAEFLVRELKAERRYMFGFWNLETGQPVIVGTRGKQGDDLVDRIIELEADGKLDCEMILEKTGSGVKATYKLTVVRDKDRKPVKVDVSKFGEFDMGLFEKMVYVKPEDKKVLDLVKLGFDVTKIGYEAPVDEENAEVEQKEQKVEAAEEKKGQTEPISAADEGDEFPF